MGRVWVRRLRAAPRGDIGILKAINSPFPALAGSVNVWRSLHSPRAPIARDPEGICTVFEIMRAGGWVMYPILLSSIVGLAIIIERFWSLQARRVTPDDLVAQVWQWLRAGVLDERRIQTLRTTSPLGRIIAAGLVNRQHDRAILKESIEETGRHVVHELERYLNTLGTIAAISPLMGLLGTVFGMIRMFGALKTHGVGDPAALAGGIAEALITTAAGLTVAIPTMYFYRYFRGRVENLVVQMEQESLKLVEVLHGEREPDDLLRGTR